MRRSIVAVLVVSMIGAGLWAAPVANASPVASSQEEYLVYNRIFPDPHGCQARTAPYSPFAKGQVCAADFMQFSELEAGLRFLEDTFPRFIKVYVLHEDFNCAGKPVGNPDKACKEFMSAGLPQTLPDDQGGGFARDKSPLYMVRITDENVPIDKKKHFVFPLSIHGIERAGAEGGTRAAEDLATWAACEAEAAPDYVQCDHPDNEAPHPLLEATPKKSITAGKAMKKSAVFMIYPNPDGWRRGERTEGTQTFMRYNGNGVDLNRDWPEQGYTFRPYTPWSEPESKAFGRVLQGVGPTDSRGNPKWTGGIDLHGQLIDRAFSFTLIGGSQRPFGKNQRVMQTVKGAWKDAEKRLAWSPLIKPNDAAADDPRVYGVQYGTIWDTIAYTVTGALGNWIDSPIGLNADGIDNEMSLSHLSNCGTGSCWSPDVEQLHVDGNKSLIYAMINYSLKKENRTFKTKGRVGYLHNPGVVKEKTNRNTTPPKFEKLPTQEDIPGLMLTTQNEWTHEFTVKGPKQDVYNGGIEVTLTCSNLQGQGAGACSVSEAQLQKKADKRDRHSDEEWETVNSYFNQGVGYNQAGQALHTNYPEPGRWRVVIDGTAPTDVFTGDIDFTKEAGWPDPGQIGYKATSMKFWNMLKKYSKPRLGKVTARELERRNAWKRRFDTIAITNRLYRDLADDLKKWVRRGGNLVLLDKAIKMLKPMKIVKGKTSVNVQEFYAGYINFATQKREVTYNDPLARKINLPGAAEGQGGDEIHRRQTYEPVPLGIAIQTADGGDSNNSPVWAVSQDAWKKIRTKHRATGTSGGTDRVSFGEIKLGKGRIRIIGALLPDPTEEFDHPFGLASYALTYAGYQVLNNALTWNK